MLQVGLNVGRHWLHLLLLMYRVHVPLSIGIVGTLFDYVSRLSLDSPVAKNRDWSPHLHLFVDQLDLLLYFLEHLGQATLFEDRLGAQEVLFGLLRFWWVIDHVKRTDNLIGLGNVQ